MTYNPDVLQTKQLPKAGDRVDAEITEINSGKIGDFVDKDVLEKWRNADAESPAVEIVAKAEGFSRRKAMNMPADGQVHPQSNLAKWKKHYGDYPRVGQKIYLIADEEGFYQFAV